MKIKYFILSGIISSAILSMTAFAEPEKTEKETEPTIAVTEVSKTVQETTSITESTTAAVTTSTTEKTTTPSFYDEILAYVGEENAPVLNENLDNNAMTIDSSTIDYSNKSMYTITTRFGDVFYLIINSDGSVYFLNPVDTADLTAMLSDSNDNKKAKALKKVIAGIVKVLSSGKVLLVMGLSALTVVLIAVPIILFLMIFTSEAALLYALTVLRRFRLDLYNLRRFLSYVRFL